MSLSPSSVGARFLAAWDLAEICAHIADHDPNAAQRVGRQLVELINQLSKMPSLGKPGRVFGTRELVTSKIGRTAYVVVYRIRAEQIEILRVLSGRQDIDQILEEPFLE
ncbi:type II toxin-antitoxin system RelE/ParE family toxin [Leptolyngbya sp. FACHB-17]|uniref:type II toxin-antitoxin system RelE/ParE family toxin n=1 Tax=unclassified Leptolyngbya TaxID=2650499 RepID=UPI001680B110|nr:type II toxin-antitoxin system RelE/ParE family toxin [Leptolyngbya sp. FACHB-17]MBD2078367.1 type II toxin-antitoxin system RelE/ParE family toxin [Leptolyngbya sp. FACHB-17]